MKIIFAVILIFVSTLVPASNDGTEVGLEMIEMVGDNDFGDSIQVRRIGMFPVEKIIDTSDETLKFSNIYITTFYKEAGRKVEELQFEKEGCSFVGGDNFSCQKNGRSPLAGTTYHRKKGIGPDCSAIVVCVSGCGPHAPHELYYTPRPANCYHQTECPKREITVNFGVSRGVINGNNVNLRENPHTASRILRTLLQGVPVEMVPMGAACYSINGKVGRWVPVKVQDRKSPQKGWIFDPYIDYQ